MQPSLKVKQVLRLCTGLCAAQGEFRTSRLAARDACEHPCYAAVLPVPFLALQKPVRTSLVSSAFRYCATQTTGETSYVYGFSSRFGYHRISIELT